MSALKVSVVEEFNRFVDCETVTLCIGEAALVMTADASIAEWIMGLRLLADRMEGAR